jgi:hypothetical protein
MPTKSLPALGESNWGTPLNNYLQQTTDNTNGGGINNWLDGTARPSGLTTDDKGKTGINTSTGLVEQWNGTTWVNLTKATITFTNIAELTAYNNSNVTQNQLALVLGYYTPNDNGGGLFYLDKADSTTATDYGATIVDASNNRWKRIIENNFVQAAWFGIIPDGGTQVQTAKFWWLGNYLRAHDGSELVFLNGKYKTKVIDCRGVYNLVIHGNGAEFDQGAYDPTYSYALSIIAKNFYSFPVYDGSPWDGVDINADQIATVARFQSTVNLLSTANVANYQVGDEVLIYGYDQQNGYGYPPNARYFEFTKIKSITGGQITLEQNLKNSYNQNWRFLPASIWNMSKSKSIYPSSSSAGDYFAGTALEGKTTLTVTNKKLGTFIVNNIDCRNCWAWWMGGSKVDIYNNCKIAGTNYIVVGQRTEFNDCEFENPRNGNEGMEIDKIIETVVFNNCKIHSMGGATSTNLVECNKCDFLAYNNPNNTAFAGNPGGQINPSPRNMVFRDCNFYHNEFSIGGFAMQSLVMEDNTFYSPFKVNNVAYGVELFAAGTVYGSLLEIKSTDGLTWVEPVNYDEGTKLMQPGARLSSALLDYELYVEDVEMDGVILKIRVRKQGLAAMTVGQKLNIPGILYTKISNPIIPKNFGYSFGASGQYDVTDVATGIKTKTWKIVGQTSNNHIGYIEINGYVKSVSVFVEREASSFQLYLYNGTGNNNLAVLNTPNTSVAKQFTINGAIKGYREIKLDGIFGTKSGDTITALGDLYYTESIVINDSYFANQNPYPKIIINIEYLPRL